MQPLYEWDEDKNESNWRKHGLRFETAAAVFDDPLQYCAFDRTVGGEDRFATIGLVAGIRVVVVVHTDRDRDGVEIVRIISARLATRQERKAYEQQNR